MHDFGIAIVPKGKRAQVVDKVSQNDVVVYIYWGGKLELLRDALKLNPELRTHVNRAMKEAD
jgi:hypothetical protein